MQGRGPGHGTISYSKSSSNMGVTFLKIAKKGERWHNGALFCPLELIEPCRRKYLSSASGYNVDPSLGKVSRIFGHRNLSETKLFRAALNVDCLCTILMCLDQRISNFFAGVH